MPKHMKFVLLSGAAGGVVSWVYSITVGVPFPLPSAFAIITCCILGAASALISVYMVANSDVSNVPRLVAFSVLCGIFWKPVIDSSVTFIQQKQDAAATQQRATTSLNLLQSSSPASLPAQLPAASQATADLLRASDQLNDPRLEQEARKNADILIQEAARGSIADPRGATDALMQVKAAAIGSNNEDIATRVDAQLTRIQAREPEGQPRGPLERFPVPRPAVEIPPHP